MMTDEIKAAYNRSKWALVLRGLFGIAWGVFIFVRPLESVAAFALVIAFWALIDGITNIVRSFDLQPVAPHWWVLLLAGIVSTLFGAAALYYYPALSLSFAVVWTALWLVTGGAMGAYVAVQERNMGLSWGWTMILSILTLVGGVLAYMYPGITLATLMGVIATFAILGGIVMLVGAGRMQSVQRDIRQAVRNPARA